MYATAGVFKYKCALHDGLGMLGKLIVRPLEIVAVGHISRAPALAGHYSE